MTSDILLSLPRYSQVSNMEGDIEESKDIDQSTMSKRQRKRLQKRQFFVEHRKIKRKEKKERKKAQKRKLQEGKETEDGKEGVSSASDNLTNNKEKLSCEKKKFRSMNSEHASSLRVAIDLSFDDLMTDRDIHKLLKQIQRTYSINRRADRPIQLYLTSFGGRSKTILDEIHCKYTSWDVHIKEESYGDVFSQEDVVYLTSDSPNVLSEVDESKAYIIGGLVDHNHHKGLCYRLVVERGIAHARLPISECVKLKSRTVITVNHVFEIMLLYSQTKDWKESLVQVLPARKMEGATENGGHKKTGNGAQKDEIAEEETDKSVEGNDEHYSLQDLN